MGSTQGEICVGPSHQAKLPENSLNLNAVDLSPDPEFCKQREVVRWVPSLTLDGDLVMYLQAARSMAALAGMCDGNSAEDGNIASPDGTTINAMDVLHQSYCDAGKALQPLVKCPMPKSIEKKWTEEETKRFVKGLSQFGKNFYRIKKDFLPHKDTSELVEFYYLWKKTSGANNNHLHRRRRRRQGSLRGNRNSRNTRGNSTRPSSCPKDQGEASSSSDDDNNSNDDSDSRENGSYRCSHCFTAISRDWLHAPSDPKQGTLCYNCLTYYKQYGELSPISRNEACLFQPMKIESPEGSPGCMSNTNKTKETHSKGKPSKSKKIDTPASEEKVDEIQLGKSIPECKSPLSGVSLGDKSKKKRDNLKRTNTQDSEGQIKRKRENGPDIGSGESDTESLLNGRKTSSSSQHIDEQSSKLEMPAPQLLLAAEQNQMDGEEMKTTSMDSTDPYLAIYSAVNLPTLFAKDSNEKLLIEDESSVNIEMNLTSAIVSTKKIVNMDMATLLQKQSDFEDRPNIVKNEGTFDLPSLDRGELLPPVLTPEENYVPKNEMSKLQANTSLLEPRASISPYPADIKCTSPYIAQIGTAMKTEPGLQAIVANNSSELVQKSTPPESPLRRTQSPILPALPISSPSLIPFSQIQPESPRGLEQPQDKLVPTAPMILPVHSAMYNENDRNEKPVRAVPSSSLNLSRHHVGYSPYHHYASHLALCDKMGNSPYFGTSGLQMQPRDLKIKQEILVPDSQRSPSIDPLQSLKEVKVPGCSNISITQTLLPTTSSLFMSLNTMDSHPSNSRFDPNSPYVGNVQTDEMKKESDLYPYTSSSATPLKSPSLEVSKLSKETNRSIAMSPKLLHTPPYQSLPPSHSQTPITRTPTASLGTLTTGSSLQNFSLNRSSLAHLSHPHHYSMSPTNPHQHYSLLAAAAAHITAVHHNPYSQHLYPGYPYSFPYLYPIPQPIPPPRDLESDKREMEAASPTLITSHHSSSSSVTTRSVHDEDHSQGITELHHHSSSHHESIHHHNEKQTISHPSSSSSSASVLGKRSSSPQHSSSSCHVSATLSQSKSSSLSMNHGQSSHHSHHHQTTTGDRLLPLVNMPVSIASNAVMPSHHNARFLSTLPTPIDSLNAPRANPLAAANINSPVLQPTHLRPSDKNDMPSPTNHISKGPSPEPKVEDSECHRSQSAIFLRHWSRGDYNSCARTDLTFKPVPDSKLDRKRQERIRKQTEKERDEREKSQGRKITTPDKPGTTKPPSRSPIETITSPYDRLIRGSPFGDTPALRQLSDYARPHTGFSPIVLPRSAAIHGLPPQCVHPTMLHYMYAGHKPRERIEIEHFEREKRERELREFQLRDKEMMNERFIEELIKSAAGSSLENPIDPHWLEIQRRLGALGPGGSPGFHPYQLYATAGQPTSLTPLERERLERLGSVTGQYRQPTLLLSREASLGLHHQDLLESPYADQLMHQAAAHEYMQRQMLERYPHPALIIQQQNEEYLRRELKARALEEAVRIGRQ